MSSSQRGTHATGSSLVLPPAPAEHPSRGVKGIPLGIPDHAKGRFWENTEIASKRRRRRTGSLSSAAKPFANKGSEESADGAPVQRGGGRPPELHWSAQEMRTGVWPSSFFGASANPRWPLKPDVPPHQAAKHYTLLNLKWRELCFLLCEQDGSSSSSSSVLFSCGFGV